MRDRVRVDRVSLASGVAVAALGALVLLDSLDAVNLSPGWSAVALTGAIGAILLIAGVAESGAGRHD